MCLLTRSRLADRPVNHHRCSPAHHALLHMLLSVLPTEVLLLRPLPVLSTDMLLPGERWKTCFLFVCFSTYTQTFDPRLCFAVISAVMQHRMLRDAEKAMSSWMNGQPLYAPISSNASSQGVPILYSGE